MTIPEAITKAIEGGWDDGMARLKIHPEKIVAQVMLLDPAFWRALGKVEGWETEDAKRYLKSGGLSLVEVRNQTREFIKAPQWRWNMHRMIDALAKGKTIEQFFETL